MIYVLATIKIAEGRRAEVLDEFRRVVPQVRAEDGCLHYQPTIDYETPINAQAASDENKIVVVEMWQNLACLQAHLAAPHMVEYRSRVQDLVHDVTLEILSPSS